MSAVMTLFSRSTLCVFLFTAAFLTLGAAAVRATTAATTTTLVIYFLSCVKNGTYTNSIIHRVVADFINQGGGYKLNSDVPSSQYVVAYATAPGFSSQSYDNHEYYDIQ